MEQSQAQVLGQPIDGGDGDWSPVVLRAILKSRGQPIYVAAVVKEAL